MRETLNRADRFAQNDATVLLLGESGTGKEVIAHYIHQRSPRCHAPYVRINCAAIPESLLESELFGHARGAFTGAERDRIGRLEDAEDGTVLLDEVGELPLPVQAKLLRVLEEGEFQRVGSNEPIGMRARVIAATNRDLTKEVADGRFRADLYYRLFVLNVNVPPLRDRDEDLQPLAEHFVAMFSPDGSQSLSRRALGQIHDHWWPGNVRELKNAIQRAVVLAESSRIEAIEIVEPRSDPSPNAGQWPEVTFAEAERRTLEAALARSGGNQAAAARMLGVTARTVSNMIRRVKEAA